MRHLLFVPDAFCKDFTRDLLAAQPLVSPVDAARLEVFTKYSEGFRQTNKFVKNIWGANFTTNCAQPKWSKDGTTECIAVSEAIIRTWKSLYIQFLQATQHSGQNGIKEGFFMTNTVVKDIWGQFHNGLCTTKMVEIWPNGLRSRLTSHHPGLESLYNSCESLRTLAKTGFKQGFWIPLRMHVSHRDQLQ